MFKTATKLRLIVESPRIELGSKQVIKELSTRLFYSWVFDCKLVKDNLLTTQLFNLESASKRYTILVNIYDASIKNAINQGFLETFSIPTQQDEANLTIIQIKQLKRSYSRRLKV